MVACCPPEAVTVYPVTGDPPSWTGRVQATYANPLPAFAATRSGAAGAAGAAKVADSIPRNAGSSPAPSTMDDGASPGPVMSWLWARVTCLAEDAGSPPSHQLCWMSSGSRLPSPAVSLVCRPAQLRKLRYSTLPVMVMYAAQLSV